MTESIYNNAGMPSEQGAAPQIPEDLRKDHAQILRMRAKGVTLPWFGNDKQIELIERIAALTLERDTLKTERDERAEQVRRYDKAIGVLTEDNASLKAKVVRMSAPPEPLVFTCPFDGEVWRFHTQEQLGRLEKHLEWHATNINSKEYPA